jgi:hypothetical protein
MPASYAAKQSQINVTGDCWQNIYGSIFPEWKLSTFNHHQISQFFF